MDNKLKDAITSVRSGDTQGAQKKLTMLLEENPEEAQGWYLLSLLVDSPQKQAAYLSKTLALNPQHPKAQEQLAALQEAGTLAPTATLTNESGQPMDVLTQSETDTLPSWLAEDESPSVKAEPVADTADPNEELPDWLAEPADLTDKTTTPPVDESPTIVNQTAKEAAEEVAVVSSPPQPDLAQKKQGKAKPAASSSTTGLNIILGILVVLAMVVIVILAYLILG